MKNDTHVHLTVLWVKNMSTWSQFCYPAVISSYQLSKRVDPTPSLKKEKENMKM